MTASVKIIGADGKEYGPIPADVVRRWIAEGRVNAQTRTLAEEGAEWRPIGTLPEFSPLFFVPPVQPGPAMAPRTNGFAVTGMIFGLFALTCGLCCCYGFPFNLLGVVFSCIGLSQIRTHPQTYNGTGMAVTGLVTSILSILLSVALFMFGFLLSWNDIMRDIRKL